MSSIVVREHPQAIMGPFNAIEHGFIFKHYSILGDILHDIIMQVIWYSSHCATCLTVDSTHRTHDKYTNISMYCFQLIEGIHSNL